MSRSCRCCRPRWPMRPSADGDPGNGPKQGTKRRPSLQSRPIWLWCSCSTRRRRWRLPRDGPPWRELPLRQSRWAQSTGGTVLPDPVRSSAGCRPKGLYRDLEYTLNLGVYDTSLPTASCVPGRTAPPGAPDAWAGVQGLRHTVALSGLLPADRDPSSARRAPDQVTRGIGRSRPGPP